MRTRIFQIVQIAQKDDRASRLYDIFLVAVAFASIVPLMFHVDRLPGAWQLGLSRSLCKSFHRNLSILALMSSSHSSWLRTRAQPGWWHPSPHLEYSSFTRR